MCFVLFGGIGACVWLLDGRHYRLGWSVGCVYDCRGDYVGANFYYCGNDFSEDIAMDKTTGLTCPECSGVVPLKEGDRIVTCPFCGVYALVQGEQGIRRCQVSRQVERQKALQDVTGFFSGIKKARDLKKEAKITDTFLIYLPYWRVQAEVAGWRRCRVPRCASSSQP